jgi:rubrerythrin
MENLSITASAIISFAETLEDSSSNFYEELAERWKENEKQFLAFAKESERNKTSVVRTYQETISDALEAGFSFEGLNLNDYAIKTTLTEDDSYNDALKIAIDFEKQACKFYLDVAERSRSLLATIPRAFLRVAKRRDKRQLELQSMLAKSMK